MDKPDYLSCRCRIDFAENPEINFLSFNYAEELKVSVEGEKFRMKDTVLPQYDLQLVGNIEKAKLAMLFSNTILLLIVNILLSAVPSIFTIKGFFTFGPDYFKYMFYQFTFLSTMIASFYSFYWAIFSRKKTLDYYGRISSTINSIRPIKCSFENAKRSVVEIINNCFIYGDNDCLKKFPYKIDYLKRLKLTVLSTEKVSQYEFEYNKV